MNDGHAQFYRDAANDHEPVNRKFHDKYAALLQPIKSTINKCDKNGCVFTIFTKGFYFKDCTTNRARGSVKGSRFGKSAGYGTCLQKCLSIDILDDLSRHEKAREKITATDIMSSGMISAQSEEKKKKAEHKGRNGRAIAFILRERHQVPGPGRRACQTSRGPASDLSRPNRAYQEKRKRNAEDAGRRHAPP